MGNVCKTSDDKHSIAFKKPAQDEQSYATKQALAEFFNGSMKGSDIEEISYRKLI
jgi:hypothetical protein